MNRTALILLLGVAIAAPLQAQRSDLPPEEVIADALDDAPAVQAAKARIVAAQAHARTLTTTTGEVVATGSYLRRSVTGERTYDEFDATLSRSFRLPGKGALDRVAGLYGVQAAELRAEDAHHQAAVALATLWHDWLAAAEVHRAELRMIENQRASLAAIRRRVALRDAAQLDVDQAQSALALAEAQAAASRNAAGRARATLAATYPQIPLPPEPPALAIPSLPPEPLEVLRAFVVERSHEIGAAAREADRASAMAARARRDRFADPSAGVRMFSERNGLERGIGVFASLPLGGGNRRALADQAGAEANAATIDLLQVRRQIAVVANAGLTDAVTRFEAWEATQRSFASASAAVARTERGYALGGIELADLLYARRQALEAERAEINARSEADRAILKLRIDAHVIWADRHDPGHDDGVNPKTHANGPSMK